MESRNSAKAPRQRKTRSLPVAPVMSMGDLAKLGGGKVAYIKVMTPDEAKELFPTVEGLPGPYRSIDFEFLAAADPRICESQAPR